MQRPVVVSDACVVNSVRLADLTGPHDYVFNRGPGAVDLLLFHDGVLNGTANQGKTTR